MATQKQIKEWIPTAIKIFQTYMPLPTLPEIHIVSKKTLFKKREELVTRLHSHQSNINPEEYDSTMEEIHGELGDAIIIQQHHILSPEKDYRAEELFQHFLWHELGHFIAITSETTNLHRYADQKLAGQDTANHDIAISERAKQEGYWMWSEFIAEVISNHVSMMYRSNECSYHPELIKWEPEEWGVIVDRLLGMLDQVFIYYPNTIDEYSLAFYFAYLLNDDFTQLYLQAAAEGKLRVSNWPLSHSKLMTPGSIEPTGISDQEEAYQEILWRMKTKLDEQLQQKSFWIIDENCLEDLGQMVVDLMNEKIALLASFFE